LSNNYCAKEHFYINNYAFDAEALLISGNGANVGYVHYYKGKFNAYQRTYILADFDCSIKFVEHFLSEKLALRISTEVNAGNTPYIVRGTLSDMLLGLPLTKAEQEAIATVLSDMDTEIEALEKKLEKARKIKAGMMHNLLTGTIRLV
jgi:type I restriction enzyme S subunit